MQARAGHFKIVPRSAHSGDSRLELYPDAGHGGIFEHHEAFVSHALEFLADDDGPDRLTAA